MIDLNNYNNIQLFFGRSWSTSYLFLMLLLVLLILYFSWSGTKSFLTYKSRFFIFLLRALILGIIIFILHQPSLVFKKLEKEKRTIAVLLDTSKSMEIKANNNIRNLESSLEFLTKKTGFFNNLQRVFNIDFFEFSDGIKKIDFSELTNNIQTAGKGTNIIGSITELKKIYKSDKILDGIIIISDGTDNILFDENLVTYSYSEVKDALKANTLNLDTPVMTIWTGVDKDFKDIFTVKLFANEFAFVKNPFTIDADIIIKGYSGSIIPVQLKEGENIISIVKIKTEKGKERYKVKFSFVPDRVGEYLYTVSVPLLSKEFIKHNNSKSVKINIMRDKVRTLLVMGAPSWDGKFVRRFLKGESYIDLITFIILRTNKNLFNIPTKDLSLIPFPTQDLFQTEKELFNFDIVIFLNFEYRPFIPYQYLKNIREFVTKKGGGFLMLGGRRSFLEGGYEGTPIEEILPVDLKFNQSGNLEKSFIEDTFKMKITNTGKYHPILKWGKSSSEVVKIFNSFPSFKGFNTSLKLKKNAIVLAEHPSKGNSFGKYPLIAVNEAGKGRSMIIASDNVWKTKFLNFNNPEGKGYFNRFWNNTIKWLTFDPEFKRVKVFYRDSEKESGEKVNFDVEVLNSRWLPSWKVKTKAILITPDNKKKKIKLKRGDKKGKYIASFIPKTNGIYKLEVIASKERAYGFLTVNEFGREREYLSVNGNLMKAIAETSGGSFFNVNNIPSDVMPFEKSPRYSLIDEKMVSLGENSYLLALIIALFSLEWFMRRKKGLK